MAEKLNVLKARIKAVTSTHKITKTMDMIARSKTLVQKLLKYLQ